MFDLSPDVLAGREPQARSKPWVHVPIVSVDLRGPLRFRPLSEQWWGVFLHFDGRSEICRGKECCQWCKAQVPKRWAGYWPACSWDCRQCWVVKVTRGAAGQLHPLRERYGQWRGLPITFRRSGSKLNSPVRVETPAGLNLVPTELPAEFDPRPVVLYVHQYSAEDVAALLNLKEQGPAE